MSIDQAFSLISSVTGKISDAQAHSTRRSTVTLVHSMANPPTSTRTATPHTASRSSARPTLLAVSTRDASFHLSSRPPSTTAITMIKTTGWVLLDLTELAGLDTSSPFPQALVLPTASAQRSSTTATSPTTTRSPTAMSRPRPSLERLSSRTSVMVLNNQISTI